MLLAYERNVINWFKYYENWKCDLELCDDWAANFQSLDWRLASLDLNIKS